MRYLARVLVLMVATGAVSAIVVGCGAEPKKPAVSEKKAARDTTPQTDDDESADKSEAPSNTATQRAAKTEESSTKADDTSKPDRLDKQPSSETAADKVVLGSPELYAGIPGEGELTMEQINAWLDEPRNHLPLDVELPLGLSAGQDQIKGLKENPLTRAKIELGRQLYFDPRLSPEGTGISCATCHDPDHGYAKDTQFGIGIQNQTGNRNSPVAYNRILSEKQFWDGRAASLEDQAKGPIANPIEMGFTHDACVVCLKEIEGYRVQFEKIFGELTIDAVAMAIASFERAIVTGPSPFDYYDRFQGQFKDLELADVEEEPELLAKYKEYKAAMDAHPMSESAKRGRELYFGKANCSGCHVGANLTDELYHNIGVGMDAEQPDLGRYAITKEERDKGAFKTPTIRNVALSAPYMHDGSQKTLEEVVEWYDKGGHPNQWLSDKIKKLNLTDQEKQDLVEFMKACTGDFPQVARGRLPK